MEDLSISRSTPLSNFKRSGEVLAIVVDGVGATISQPYAVAVFSVTASAAFRITSSTKLGWDSIGTWLLSVSKVFAPHTLCDETLQGGLDGTVTAGNDVPARFRSPSCTVYLLIE